MVLLASLATDRPEWGLLWVGEEGNDESVSSTPGALQAKAGQRV